VKTAGLFLRLALAAYAVGTVLFNQGRTDATLWLNIAVLGFLIAAIVAFVVALWRRVRGRR
jgi:hypothetical protein